MINLNRWLVAALAFHVIGSFESPVSSAEA
jgi:hypothetical protein